MTSTAMRIEPAKPDDIYRVALNMRDADYAEFMAVSFAEDRETLANTLVQRFSERCDVLVGLWHGEPVCIGGFIASRPGVISLLFFATDDFHRIGLGITRFIKTNLFPKLADGGIHRFEAVSMASHTKAHAWLKALGLTQETGPMLGYGRGGEPYIQFAMVKSNACTPR